MGDGHRCWLGPRRRSAHESAGALADAPHGRVSRAGCANRHALASTWTSSRRRTILADPDHPRKVTASPERFAKAKRRAEIPERAPSESRPRARWVTSRLAEAVAEQRLLWRLRRESAAELVYPAPLSESRAQEVTRGCLRSDLDRRRLWCVIDTLLALLCAPFTLIPGPNLPAYYFVFRAVGHFLALRGAQHGLSQITWTSRPPGRKA
jgi:hypothetical protein